MGSLQKLQKDFFSALLDPSALEQASDFIKPSGKLTASQHMAIYQHSYIARLQQCMEAQFSALKTALGDQLFSLFSSEYLRTFPSKSYTLNNLGDRFTEFLDSTRPDIDPNNEENWPAFIIELARFEYLINEVFDEPTNKGESTQQEHEDLYITNHARLCIHEYPVCQYFNEIKQNPNAAIPIPKREVCVIFRHQFRIVMLEVFQESEEMLLKLMLSGASWKQAAPSIGDAKLLNAIQTRWQKEGLLVSDLNKD